MGNWPGTGPYAGLSRAGVLERSAGGPSLLFFMTILAVFSLRAWLRDPADFYFINLNRLVSAVLATIFFGSIATALARNTGAPRRRKIELIVLHAAVAAIVISLVRMAIDVAGSSMDISISLAQTSIWLLIWIAYYSAGCAAFLVLEQPGPAVLRDDRWSAAIPAPQQPYFSNDEAACLWIERGRQRVRISLAEIEVIEADGDYLRVHSGETEGIIRMTLVSAERKLAPCGFVRVHRSFLCKRGAIAVIFRSGTGAMKARLQNGREVPVGRSYRPVLANLIQGS